MDLGRTDQGAVLGAEWLEAVIAISQMLAFLARTANLVHTSERCHLCGRFVGRVGDLAPGLQHCQSTSCLDASGAQRSDPLVNSVLALP